MLKKLTPEDLEARVESCEYYVRVCNTTTTICALKTISGFVVIGKSACLNEKDFDSEMGKKIAKEDAINQLWELEGYRVNNEHYANTI